MEATVYNFSQLEIDKQLKGVDGDEIVGTLDAPLIAGFCEMSNVELTLDELSDFYRRRLVQSSAKAVEGVDDMSDYNSLFEAASSANLFENEAEAVGFLQLMAEHAELSANFWRRVRTELNAWNYWLEIRKGFKVVSTGKKFTVGEKKKTP
jgi:hypothetical protein